jgi:hypothetical protein
MLFCYNLYEFLLILKRVRKRESILEIHLEFVWYNRKGKSKKIKLRKSTNKLRLKLVQIHSSIFIISFSFTFFHHTKQTLNIYLHPKMPQKKNG